MKSNIHPEYREVMFKDSSTGEQFLCRSTIATKDTIKLDNGKEYPLVKLDISSYSHPFYTGTQRLLDTEGRVEKFMKKYGKK